MATPLKGARKFEYRPELLNTLMANVNLGNLQPEPNQNKFHVPLGVL